MTSKKSLIVSISLLTLILVLSGLPALAQDKEKQSDNMQILREKVRADKKLFMAQNMQLTEAQAKGFWPIYESYQNDLMKYNDRVMAMIKSYASGYESMTETSAKQLLDTYFGLEMDRVNMGKAYLPKLQAVLPNVKIARFYQLENKIQAAISFDAAIHIPLIK
jgi:hypothetical protein